MKKQFNRMKQLANQTVGRAEKTEVLSEDLLQIERRLDTVRSMCHHSHKRLIACFQGQHGTDAERRHKKLPLTALAQNMQEASAQLEESLLGKMLETCGDAENQLALELSQHEVFVEKEIVDPLYGIAELVALLHTQSVFMVSGALKSYLRELPEPLMTFNLYEEWTQVASVQDQDKKLQYLWTTCQKLPPQNFVNFRYLIKFLAKLAQTSDINKMTPSNIAIVLGPNLLWAKQEGTLAEIAAATSVHVVAVIEPIIQHADWFFPGEVEFNVSEAFVPLATPNSNHSSHTGNDSDLGTLERKRPASMAVMEGDLVKKESFGVKLMDFQAHRRGGTLNRKHISPAFQPPLPPTDGNALAPAGPEPPSQSSRADSSSGGGPVPSSAGILEQGLSPGDSSPPKPKDSVSAALPAAGRNSNQMTTVPNQAQTGGNSNQLSVGTPHSAAGPSPHTLRRAVKKPAPAPPKPGNPPPGHPGGQSSSGTGTSPKPSARSPSPPQQQQQQQQTPGMRRCSSSLPPIQAPSHPPPQPPTQPRLGEQGPEPGPTPPQTPTPPSTPPLAKQNLSQSETTQLQGTLPRPRPVPKPRNRPSVPPPPNPPGTHTGDGGLTPAVPTASRIVTDTNSRVSESIRSIFPEIHSDLASKEVPGHILLDIDNDTESTAL
ncbi:rho GTPase-activating protein 17 [Arvicanthis niloticus]|uniref:rho GTPase-activating protein 17 n=1 Tax=Arvicanthis niloticus TaxID=61156 RepID=UPI00403D258D